MNPMIYVGLLKKTGPFDRLNKEDILKTICEYLEMNFAEVKNRKTRAREFAYARHLYAYFCRIYTKDSFSEIGKFLKKDHSTILHSNKQVSGWIDFDKSVDSDVKEIHKRLKIDLKISKENIAETILQHQN